MIQGACPVTSVEALGAEIYVVRLHSPRVAASVLPGQFVNIRVNDSFEPLLRRPFSVYRVDHEEIELIFNVIGKGTSILSTKRPGDTLDVIGPLGRPYVIDDDYETALLVAGGLGVAPLPVVTEALRKMKRRIVTFLGGRTRDHIVARHLENVYHATDDGSEGFHGTVVDLLRENLKRDGNGKSKIFACGPNRMLESLSQLAHEFGILCEASLESAMACGIGICQGCPVERVGMGKKYSLICKEGPVFDTRTIRVE